VVLILLLGYWSAQLLYAGGFIHILLLLAILAVLVRITDINNLP
jgi:hypothetical protein